MVYHSRGAYSIWHIWLWVKIDGIAGCKWMFMPLKLWPWWVLACYPISMFVCFWPKDQINTPCWHLMGLKKKKQSPNLGCRCCCCCCCRCCCFCLDVGWTVLQVQTCSRNVSWQSANMSWLFARYVCVSHNHPCVIKIDSTSDYWPVAGQKGASQNRKINKKCFVFNMSTMIWEQLMLSRFFSVLKWTYYAPFYTYYLHIWI